MQEHLQRNFVSFLFFVYSTICSDDLQCVDYNKLNRTPALSLRCGVAVNTETKNNKQLYSLVPMETMLIKFLLNIVDLKVTNAIVGNRPVGRIGLKLITSLRCQGSEGRNCMEKLLLHGP